ncbi:MAG: hypothetical protein O6945_06405, partial [Gammaproteobacteria bacterium]|nr:hypothetical protein [Gammaproteobacteria bacterium]
FALDHDNTAAAVEGLKRAADQNTRMSELDELEISITPPAALTEESVDQCKSLGVSRLILLQRGQTEEELLTFVEQTANTFINQA